MYMYMDITGLKTHTELYVHRPHLKVNHTCMHVGVGVVNNYQRSTPGLLVFPHHLKKLCLGTCTCI